MGKYLRGNEEKTPRKRMLTESQFAQKVLQGVGGSQVYIEPRKVNKKLIDLTEV